MPKKIISYKEDNFVDSTKPVWNYSLFNDEDIRNFQNGTHYSLYIRLLAACPNRSYLEAHGFGLDRYIEHPLVLDQGMALAPTRPGHGITFDWKGLAQLAQ